MRGTAAKLRARNPGAATERRHRLEQPMGLTSMAMMTYSAMAGSWPNTLQMVTPFGTAPVPRRSSPAATDCSRRRRGAGGNDDRQM